MVSYTSQSKHKKHQKHQLTLQKYVCTHVTSSETTRYSAVKLATDSYQGLSTESPCSYQFWIAHLNLRVTFQSHTVCEKSAKYGDTFSKSSSLQT